MGVRRRLNDELVDVMGQIFGADAVMGTEQPGLEVGEDPVDPRQLFGRVLRVPDHGRLVLVGPAQGPVGMPSRSVRMVLLGAIVSSAKRAKVAADRSGTTASLIRPEPWPRTSTAPARIDFLLSRLPAAAWPTSTPPT